MSPARKRKQRGNAETAAVREEARREELERLSRSLEEKDGELRQLRARDSQLASDNERLKEQASRLEEEMALTRRALEAKSTEVGSLMERASTLEQAIEAKSRECQEVLQSVGAVREDVQKKDHEIADLHRRLHQNEKTMAALRAGRRIDTAEKLADTSVVLGRMAILEAVSQSAGCPDLHLEDLQVAGNLRMFSPLDLLSWARSSQLSGILNLTAARFHPLEVVLHEGCPVQAISGDFLEADGLGSILVGQGLLSAADLKARLRQFPRERHLGEALVTEGFLSTDALCDALVEQSLRFLRQVVRARSGTFLVFTGRSFAVRYAALRPGAELLLTRMRRIDWEETLSGVSVPSSSA